MSGKAPPIVVNTRALEAPLTGVQRYTRELIACFGERTESIAPGTPRQGIQGHGWEQLVLPRLLGRRPLFSPANTGPLQVREQVVTVHDVVVLDHPEWFNSRFAAWYRFLVPRLVRRVAHVITVSEFSRRRLLAHAAVDESRVTVIPNGVDERFRPLSETERTEDLSALKLPSRRYVLCVGSLEPRKNLARLLQAWDRVHREMSDDVWLVLTGKRGEPRIFADAAGLAELPARVHLTGYVPDRLLPALYAGALVFAFPSVYEGFGLPPLEAMASGVPILTGNRTALPEVVGDAGLSVDPFDVDAIADGLQRLVSDSTLRQDLRRRGLARTKALDWNATAERTWEILEGVAGC